MSPRIIPGWGLAKPDRLARRSQSCGFQPNAITLTSGEVSDSSGSLLWLETEVSDVADDSVHHTEKKQSPDKNSEH